MYGQMDLDKWIYGMIMQDMIKYQKEIKKVGEEGGRTKKIQPIRSIPNLFLPPSHFGMFIASSSEEII